MTFNKELIKKKATKLHNLVWSNKNQLWPDKKPSYIDMLEPSIVCKLLEIDYCEHEELGRFGEKNNKFEVAGSINRSLKIISVAKKFGNKVTRFTAAHEIGHWILHPDESMHRDRPIESLKINYKNEPKEQEANYFAACYLMPENLLRTKFKEIFLTETPLHFNENIAFWLNQDDYNSLLYSDPDSLDREFSLASCQNFNNNKHYSLADLFKVSKSAMAYRLHELGFVKYP
ncbi:MAG: ImmA/IrrE family metallo-endopeptidase [Proteobacteria bacterium]|nr:ImmA/IrrE family metallo-endopeptidase [Pseudomonadota bacterium]